MKRYIFLLISLIPVSITNAQWSSSSYGEFVAKKEFQTKRVVPPSPEAAELGKYGNLPVSLFTGTPKLTIPLHELRGNRLDLSVNLSYNASGFKPEDIATWVGLGWSLNAGGAITRSVMGSPDVSWNYFKSNNSYANPPATSDKFATYDYMDSIRKNYNEGQPDVYYYNFAGHTGKFLLNPDQSVVTKEKNNLIITHCITCTPSSSTFTIVDENGNTYSFTDVEVSTLQTDDGTSDATQVHSYTFPSTWYLSSITSADSKEQITFTYYDGGTHTLYNNYVQNGSVTYSASTQDDQYPTWQQSSSTTSSPPTVSVTRKYLQKISFITNGVTTSYIDFISTADQRQDLTHATPGFTGERLLQSIKEYGRNTSETYNLTKQFNLSYSYFTNTSSSQYYYKRLRLDNVQEIPTDGGTATIPAYTFEYNTSNVPALTSSAVDHWGFSNGDQVTTLVPTVTVDGNDFGSGADREPTLAGSSCASLVKIKYPTGGYTTFEYELNQAKDLNDNSVRPVGGIRVKQIIDYSFDSKKATVKNYSYALDDGTTSGRSNFPVYYKSSSYHAYTYYVGVYMQPAYNIYYMTVSANSVFGLGSIQGSHVGYSKVTESLIDLSTNATLGKTVYNYNIAGFNSYDDNVANGDLKVQSTYDNGGKLLDEQTNTYTYTTLNGISGYTVQASTAQDNQTTLCRYTSGGITYDVWKQYWETNPSCSSSRTYMTKFSYTGYTTAKQYKQLTETSEKKYDQLSSSYITTVQKFSYNTGAHTLPISIEQSTNNDEVIITQKKYPLDYTIPGGTLDVATQGIQLLQTKNIIGAEIESVQKRQTSAGSNQRYINGLLTFYDASTAYPVSVYRLETTTPIASGSFSLSSTNGTFSYNSNYKPLASFTYHSTSGNLSQQAKDNDISTAYVWDNDYTKVTAEVVNADAASVGYSSFESNGLGNWTSISNPSGNRVSGGITGNYSYSLGSGAITKTGLSSSKIYIVSYWSKSGAITVSSSAGSASATTGISLIKNGWTYYQHLIPSGATSVTLSGSSSNIDELRLYPADAMMQTYTYNLDHGLLVAQCSSKSGLAYYEYDTYNRLVNVKDDDGNIVKNFKYNYGPGSALTASTQTLYYSAEQTGSTYTKQTSCNGGTYLPTIVYKVPYGKYVSSVSQTAADNLAIADRDANGQAAANALPCLYGNALYRPFFQKNNCTDFQGPGNSIRYVIAAGTFKAATQALADQMAYDDAAANGQAYANANAGCYCAAEGQKYINSTCETGTRINSSTVQVNGQWQCTYYYQFSDSSVSQYYYEYSSSPCPIY